MKTRSKTLGKLADPKPKDHWKDRPKGGALTITFTSGSQPTMPATEPPPSSEPESEPPSWITAEHLAMWDVGKMREVIQICKLLNLVPKRGKTCVRSFAAPTGQTPQPHTWGEVALIQGRIVAGTWLPPDRLQIKIFHHNELLGQAIFDKGLVDGCDKSDLPQTQQRPTLDECPAWCEEANAIQGELPADFVPPRNEADDLDPTDPTYSEQARLLSASHAMDLAWAKEKAIDQDKYRRMRQRLYEKIDATFCEASGQPI